jgi:hypothetical protein
MRYIIKAQGYDPVGSEATLKEAQTVVKGYVAMDRAACRKKFRSCFVEVWPNEIGKETFWEVRAGQHKDTPMWSRYTIHEVA